MYTARQLEASRGGITLPAEPASPTPIAFAMQAAAFLICVPFAGCAFGWSLLQLVLA